MLQTASAVRAEGTGAVTEMGERREGKRREESGCVYRTQVVMEMCIIEREKSTTVSSNKSNE